MIIKKGFSIAVLFLLFFGIYAQEAVLEREVTEDMFNKEKGPNLKKFDHLYVAGSTYITNSDEVEVKPVLSNDFVLGYRYKYKLLSFYNIGFDISYHHLNYNLKQNDDKVVPNSITHDKEVINFNAFDLELYQRFQLGKTGNMIGFFIDMGGYVGWVFGARHIIHDEVSGEDPYNAALRITKHKDLDYTKNLDYGYKVRIGYNNIGICGSYRIADFFDDSFGYPELPRLSVGIELGLH